MKHHVRTAFGAAAFGSLLLLTSACGTKTTPVATEATSVATPVAPSIGTPESIGNGGKNKQITTPPQDSATVPGKKSSTTVASKATGPEFAADAIAAFKAKLGDYKALELTVNFNSASNRAEVQAQDPSKPANVDAYEYTGSDVGGPVPVKLTGSGKLEDNLFSASAVAWDQLPQMFDQAKSSIGEIEGSKGVTHFIVKKNLPFDEDTVVNIYIDGGPRGDGGYVSFKADGTLKKVFGPSTK